MQKTEEAKESRNRVVIIGVGNVLLKDEGIGIHILNELKKQGIPKEVEVINGGTGGLRLLNLLEGYEKAIVLDAVRAGKKPGTLYRLTIDECKTEEGLFLTVHDLNLPQIVKMAKMAKIKIPSEIIIIGIEPKTLSQAGLELSEEVKKSIPSAVKLVLEEIKCMKSK